jgi:hypothetical protein
VLALRKRAEHIGSVLARDQHALSIDDAGLLARGIAALDRAFALSKLGGEQNVGHQTDGALGLRLNERIRASHSQSGVAMAFWVLSLTFMAFGAAIFLSIATM